MRKLLFAIGLLAIAACQGEATSDQYLSRARDYIEESDFASATIELQNALKLDANLAEARWLLGQIYLEGGNIPAAEHELERAKALNWNANDLLPAFARTYLPQGKYAETLALEPEGLDPPAAARLLASQSLAALAEGNVDKASELVALAQAENPQSEDARLAGATILLVQKDAEGALEEVNAVLAVAPNNGWAWRLKGQALLKLNRLEEARDAMEQSIAYSRVAFSERVVRALINLQFEEYEAAQSDATELLALSPASPVANYIQGLLYFEGKNYLNAIAALNEAEPIAAQFPLTYYFLSLSYLHENNVDFAALFAGKFEELYPNSGAGKLLRAVTLLQTGKAGEAHEVLRPVLLSNPEDLRTLNIMANALSLDDQAYSALAMYSRIAELDPDWQVVPLRQESVLVTSEPEEWAAGVAALETDPKANFPQPEILQIREHLAKKDFPAAIDVAKSYQFRAPDSLSPHLLLGRIYLDAGETGNARKAFEKAVEREPGNFIANQNLADMALQADDPEGARQYFEDVLRHDKNHMTALLRLAELEARLNNHDRAVKLSMQAINAHPQALEPRANLAGYYLVVGKPNLVAPLFAPLDESQPPSPVELELTGMALLAQQEYSAALEPLEGLVAALPGSPRFHYLLAMAAEGAGDLQRSKSELLETVKLDEKHIPALLALARMANAEREDEQLAQYLAKLDELAPESLDVLRLRALSELQRGNTAAALALTQQAFDKSPSTQTALELTSAQEAAGKRDEARTHLLAWMEKNPRDVSVRVALANQYERGGQVAEAIAQYRQVIAIDPDNAVALNNLAWSLKETDPQKALEYISRAADISPNAAVLDTLALIQHLNGDNQGAKVSVKSALALMPDEPSIRYHGAMIDAARGDTAAAIKTLAAITAAGAPAFPEQSEAVALLATLRQKTP